MLLLFFFFDEVISCVMQGHLYIIDVSQSVDLDHPHALDFLREDCIHVSVSISTTLVFLLFSPKGASWFCFLFHVGFFQETWSSCYDNTGIV